MSATTEPLPLPVAALPPWRWRLAKLLALAAVGAAAVAGAERSQGLPFWLAVALGGLLVVAATVVVRPLLPPLFGPILFYDLVSTARRGRQVIVRCAYIAALLVMLFLLYAEWFGRGGDLTGLLSTERIDRNQVTA